MRRLLPFILALVVAWSCGSPTAPEVPPGAVRVIGTVHFYTFEGGFWAVRGDDGVTYDPIGGLPPAFQRENLRVTMIVKVLGVAGIHMVGPIVEIVQITSLSG